VLLIDELGYLTLKPEQVNAFFKLLGERYGKKSSILTTNLDYPEWYDLFQRKTLVDALLDRLQHHCITIRIKGPSLRASSNATGKTITNLDLPQAGSHSRKDQTPSRRKGCSRERSKDS
jgi:DNA replication protein DnaC